MREIRAMTRSDSEDQTNSEDYTSTKSSAPGLYLSVRLRDRFLRGRFLLRSILLVRIIHFSTPAILLETLIIRWRPAINTGYLYKKGQLTFRSLTLELVPVVTFTVVVEVRTAALIITGVVLEVAFRIFEVCFLFLGLLRIRRLRA
jgi:hypothetical protein